MVGNTLILDAIWVDKAPFPTAQESNSDEEKIFRKYYSGPARYIGWMDIILLKELIKKHNITHIIIQNLDVLGKIAKDVGRLKICVGYHYKNFIINKLLFKEEKVKLKKCKPIYKDCWFGGWEISKEDTELPTSAKSYLRFIILHTQVNYITYTTDKCVFTVKFDDSGKVVFESEPNL